jgi:hypothetical protein
MCCLERAQVKGPSRSRKAFLLTPLLTAPLSGVRDRASEDVGSLGAVSRTLTSTAYDTRR